MYRLKVSTLSAVPSFFQALRREYDKIVASLKEEKPDASVWDVELKAAKVVRENLGGHIHLVGTGGAPVSPDLLQWMKHVFQNNVIESYGTTEVGSIYCDNVVNRKCKVRVPYVPRVCLWMIGEAC